MKLEIAFGMTSRKNLLIRKMVLMLEKNMISMLIFVKEKSLKN